MRTLVPESALLRRRALKLADELRELNDLNQEARAELAMEDDPESRALFVAHIERIEETITEATLDASLVARELGLALGGYRQLEGEALGTLAELLAVRHRDRIEIRA